MHCQYKVLIRAALNTPGNASFLIVFWFHFKSSDGYKKTCNRLQISSSNCKWIFTSSLIYQVFDTHSAPTGLCTKRHTPLVCSPVEVRLPSIGGIVGIQHHTGSLDIVAVAYWRRWGGRWEWPQPRDETEKWEQYKWRQNVSPALL